MCVCVRVCVAEWCCLPAGGDGEGLAPAGHEGAVQCWAEGVHSGVKGWV